MNSRFPLSIPGTSGRTADLKHTLLTGSFFLTICHRPPNCAGSMTDAFINNTTNLIAPDRPSSVYGITWLQVYSYYNGHCSRDRWPLKSFVAFLMLVDTVNLAFCISTTYQFAVTNFGDYQSIVFDPWGQSAITLSAIILGVSVEHFYAYRVYRLGRGSPYLPAAISVIALIEFGLGILFSAKALKHTHDPDPPNFEGFFIATLIPKVPCDVLVTSGMVYHLLSNRTQVRRTNNVLNRLTIYSINCGTLHLVTAIVSVTLFAKYPETLIYTPTLFIMFRLSLCAFMAILNSRDYLRETLDGPGGVVTTFTQLKHQHGCPEESSTSFSSNRPFSDSVIAFEHMPRLGEQ
ncbi:hypothetical protein EDB89DRAFT_683160 [Lactarius sanguifluus]|nr:hypothetical protein EDB89DRAFT_683160 [Lactarius sanguifluus]